MQKEVASKLHRDKHYNLDRFSIICPSPNSPGIHMQINPVQCILTL